MKYQKIISIFAVLFFAGCKVLFWRDAEQWAGGAWNGAETFIEIKLSYETKLPWFPLNQNILSRDYETTLYKHTIRGEKIQTIKLTSYEGWTLSVLPMGDSILAIRGLGNSFGGQDREIIRIPAGDLESKEILPSTGRPPQFILPSPDGRILAVFATNATPERPTGRQNVFFYDLTSSPMKAISSSEFEHTDAPSIPISTWGPNSSKVYVLTRKAVVEINPGNGKAAQSSKFPVCFRHRVGEISSEGRLFLRNQDGSIKFERAETALVDGKDPMTSDRNAIHTDCL